MDEARFDPLDYVSAFNRRKWYFLVPVAISIVVGSLLVWKLPRAYESATTIAVGSPRLSQSLLGTAPVSGEERLRAVSQQLLSRQVLERAAQLEGLTEDGSLEVVAARMRRNIGISRTDSIAPGGGGTLSPEEKAQLDSYQITYVDTTPENAQRILNRIAQVFVEENSKSREIRAQDTSEFISAQLRASEERLNGLEAQLREMKESHMGRLPEQTNANLQMVSGLQRQLEANATTLRGEQDRLTMIERQIESMQQGAGDASAVRGTPAESAQAHAFELRRELSDAQLTFTDRHPEIMRLKEELATAERAAAAERTRPASDRLSILQLNPEYRQLVKDRDTTKLRISELQRAQTQTHGAIREYQVRVETAPRVEQELVSLQRAYDLERAAYGDLSEKRQAALLNEELQRKQGGEQFAILVPAGFPSEPSKPKPFRVMLMALAAGFVLGGAGVVGREYLDRSVHDARGLRDEFELLVLAEIPRIEPVAS